MLAHPDQHPYLRPTHTTGFLDLPLCRLHIARAGSGPPLIMLPATISHLENWFELIDFAAQWFDVVFFELPGHGQSGCFPQPFTTELIGPLVEQIADHLGFERFSLMGFSFGGVLALQTLLHLQPRIDRMMLLAPCLTWRAIQLSARRRALILQIVRLFKNRRLRTQIYHLLHDAPFTAHSAALLQSIGRVESNIPMEVVLKKIQLTTLEILTAQMDEVLRFEYPQRQPVDIPCFFAMSVIDPLLDYPTTRAALLRLFAHPSITELNYPFHQPPRPFTFAELNSDYRASVEAFLADR